PEGKSSLMLEIPCTVGDATWNAPQHAIYERCMDDLKALGFGDLRRDTRAHFASYVEEGYPIYHLDYQRQRRQLLDFVGEKTNLIPCGGRGAFRYVFMDPARERGIAAARALLDGAGARGAISEMRSERGLVEARAHTACPAFSQPPFYCW